MRASLQSEVFDAAPREDFAAPYGPGLERARDIYLGATEEQWDGLRDQIRPYADQVVAEVEAARS